MRIVLRFAAIALLLVAAGFVAAALPAYRTQYRILKTWPATDAHVLRGEIVRHVTTAGDPLYGARLVLAYAVGGTPYIGVYDFPHESTHLERKEKQIGRFPPGSREVIRYNPEEPRDIRIRVGYNVDFFVVPIFITGLGVICATLSAVLWVLSTLGRRTPQGKALAPRCS